MRTVSSDNRQNIVRGPPRKPRQSGEYRALSDKLKSLIEKANMENRARYLDWQSPTSNRPDESRPPRLQGSRWLGVAIPHIQEQLRLRKLQGRSKLHSRTAEVARLEVPVRPASQPLAEEYRGGREWRHCPDRTGRGGGVPACCRGRGGATNRRRGRTEGARAHHGDGGNGRVKVRCTSTLHRRRGGIGHVTVAKGQVFYPEKPHDGRFGVERADGDLGHAVTQRGGPQQSIRSKYYYYYYY